MTPHRPLSLSLLSLALGAALSAPAHAQSLLELVESARTYDTTWQSARAQLDAASRRADQARAGLLPSAALTAGLSRANVELSRPPVENTGTTQIAWTDLLRFLRATGHEPRILPLSGPAPQGA